MLASPSRVESIEEDPFVGVVTISRAEFDAVVVAVTSRGLELEDGRPTDDLGAYAVVVEDGGRASHASIGLDETTVGHLVAIADALEPRHRAPLETVVEQVRSLVFAG